MSLTTTPHFGAKLYLKPPLDTRYNDVIRGEWEDHTIPTPDDYREHADVLEQEDKFAASVAKIHDEKDPLEISITTGSQAKATIYSEYNGHESLRREDGQTLTAFIENAIQKAAEKAKTLLTREEVTQKQHEQIRQDVERATEQVKKVSTLLAEGSITDLNVVKDDTYGKHTEFSLNGKPYRISKSPDHSYVGDAVFRITGYSRGEAIEIVMKKDEVIDLKILNQKLAKIKKDADYAGNADHKEKLAPLIDDAYAAAKNLAQQTIDLEIL